MSTLPIWSSEEAAAATGGRSTAQWQANGVSIDSRSIQPGELFVALRGPNFDGHLFVADAFARGAAAAMVADEVPQAPGPLLCVQETMRGLEALAAAARRRAAAKIVAITGSVGKTGTKEALKRALDGQAPTHASAGNLNNQWGAPLSLARMARDAGFGIFELGMNHPGELGPLSRLVRPHVAIVTTVEAVHLEFFSSVSAIADAKAEIFEGLQPGGIAVLNRDNPHFDRLAAAANAAGAAQVIGFGSHAAAEARLVRLVQHPTCNCVSAEIAGQGVTYKVGAPGRHWAMNSLAVLAAVHAMGADLGLAALALADLSPPKGRGQRHRVLLGSGQLELIDESYNASPSSMAAALDLLGQAQVGPRGRRIAVLGDMLELGPAAGRLHAGLAEDVRAAGVDLVFAAGPEMAHLFRALPKRLAARWEADSAALLPAVLAEARGGDVVMVKGSLGSRMAPIVEALLRQGGDAAARAG